MGKFHIETFNKISPLVSLKKKIGLLFLPNLAHRLTEKSSVLHVI